MSSKPLIEGKDIIVVGQQPWDVEIGSNCKNIAEEFSLHNRVLYINSALDRGSSFRRGGEERIKFRKEVIAHRQNGLIKVHHNLWTYYPDTLLESINWMHNRPVFNFLNKINNRRFAGSIRKAIAALGFGNYLLFNDSDIFKSFYLPDLLKPEVSMYYSRDYLLTVDYWKFHGSVLEPQLIAKSDVCTANSTYLADYCRKHNPHSYYVGQGCDLDVFTSYDQTQPAPADMAAFQKPLIGYVGALQSIRLDIDLLAHIARSKPEWTIVLVGPEDEVFKKSELHSISNVKFLGAKPGTEVPAYIAGFDVCLNPQAVNEVTIGNYPRKIDEYLAMGKPVVATRTEGMRIFDGHTYLGNTGEEYVNLISRALQEDSPALQQQRIAFAQTHSWENSVKAIYEAVLKVKPDFAAANTGKSA